MTSGKLFQPQAQFVGDLGQADPELRAALAATDKVGYLKAISKLCAARFLLPVVAAGGDGDSELAVVTLDVDGEHHLLAFTGIDAMQAWRADARPKLCLLDELASAATEMGVHRVLLDCAGPVPFVVSDQIVAQCAQGFALVELEPGNFGWVKAVPQE